jgi:hypothetical protein
MRTWRRSTSIALALAAACGPTAGTGGPGGDNGDGDGNGNGSGSVADGGGDPMPGSDAPPVALIPAVYAHSAQQLFRVDPDTLDVSLVGTFQWPLGPDEMTDIAVDKDGKMTGISYTRIYAIDKDTADCTYLSNVGASFNGLSWVPANTVDPNAPEILVAASGYGDVVKINPLTGGTTTIGNYGNGWVSSGDIVAVKDLGILATVNTGEGNDFLARIHPSTWEATIVGDTGSSVVWGLGYWKDRVYGFTEERRFLLIDPASGLASPVETGAVDWWGAGVTTRAPVVE